MTRPAPIPAALLAALVATAAAGQQAAVSDPPGREAAAWIAADAIQGDLVPLAHKALFMQLAWHATAANLCPGLLLDHERFGTAWAGIEHADMASLSDAEHAYFRHHLAVSFGVAVGIMLAEHAGTPEEIAVFCDEALAVARDPALPGYFDTEALPTQ